jgi:hypothetical protein
MDKKQIYFSEDIAHRLAAIDIGSNSVRLLVAEPLRGGNYRILDEEREPTRLGRTLSSTGRLDAESIRRTLSALRSFKQIAAGFQVDELRTIATCAVREAANGAEFCRRAKEEIGINVEVISSRPFTVRLWARFGLPRFMAATLHSRPRHTRSLSRESSDCSASTPRNRRSRRTC